MRVYRNGLAAPAGTVPNPLETDLDVGGNKVTDVDDPTTGTDAANLQTVRVEVLAPTAPVVLKGYTVATLPAAPGAGAVAFATDGLKDGETTGNGTGVPVCFDGTIWCRTSDDTEVED